MNKALEQKLIGPLEESHTNEQSHKAVCERCLEQGDRKSQQKGLELVLELDNGVCGRKKECVGAVISGGGPSWAHEAGGAPGGVGCAPTSWAPGAPPTHSCTHTLLLPPKKITNQLKHEF